MALLSALALALLASLAMALVPSRGPLHSITQQPLHSTVAETPTAVNSAWSSSGSHNVLLTGATGFLGSRVLQELLALNSGTTVACIVRCDNEEQGSDRLRAKLVEYKVWPLPGWERVQILVGDTASPRLGLTDEKYAHIASTATSIVHAAASINLRLPVDTLHQVNVQSLDAIIDLAGAGDRNTYIVYMSSIASVILGKVKFVAESLEDIGGEECAFPGYGQTKWRAEQYLKERVTQLGLTAVVVRTPFIISDRVVQQMTVPTLLVQIACVTKLLPAWVGGLPMYPIGPLSRGLALAAVDLSMPAGQVTVLHFAESNPKPYAVLQEQLAANGLETRIVPLAEWSAALKAAAKVDAFAKQLVRGRSLIHVCSPMLLANLATNKTSHWMKEHDGESFDEVEVWGETWDGFFQATLETAPEQYHP